MMILSMEKPETASSNKPIKLLREFVYKTLGTNFIYSPMSPPSLKILIHTWLLINMIVLVLNFTFNQKITKNVNFFNTCISNTLMLKLELNQ